MPALARSFPGRPTLAILGVLVVVLCLPGSPLRAGDPVCAACGKPIEGEYIKADGRKYHEGHFVCALCRKPLSGEYVVHEGRNYHTSCYTNRVAPRCALCGKTIEGRYLEDYWGNAYHARHEGEEQRCEYCTRFISPELTGGGVEYKDGRIVCRLCQRRAIDRDDEAADVMRSVAASLRRDGIGVDTRHIDLHLVDRQELKKLAGRGHALQGFTQLKRRSLAGKPVSTAVGVHILEGMPREEAVSTIAHELMHVWLFLRQRDQKSAPLTEGSCNYAAYLALKDEKGPLSGLIVKAMMENDDPAYGKGFRRVKRFAEDKGTKVWLDLLATKDRLPAGY